MHRMVATIAAAAALGLSACAGGDDEEPPDVGQQPQGTVSAPATLPEQTDDGPTVERAELVSCLEDEGLQVFGPEEQIPGTQGGRLEVGTDAAEQIAVFWPESEHVADVFVAEDAEAVEEAENDLTQFLGAFGGTDEQIRQFVQRAGNVIVTPDNEAGPTADELAQLRECIG